MRARPRSSSFSESAPERRYTHGRRRQPSPVTKNCGGSSSPSESEVGLSLISCRDINGRDSTTSDGDGTSSASPSLPRPRSILLIEDPYIVNPRESTPSKRKRSNFVSSFEFRRDTLSIGSSSSLEDSMLVGWLNAMANWDAKREGNNEEYSQWKMEFLAIGNRISQDFLKTLNLISCERELQGFLNLPNLLEGLVGDKMRSIVQLAAGRKALTEGGNKINKAGRDVYRALHRALQFLQHALRYEVTSLEVLRKESRELGIKVNKMRGLTQRDSVSELGFAVSMRQDLTAEMSMRIGEVWSELGEALTTTTYNSLCLQAFEVFALHLVWVSSLQGGTGKIVSFTKDWRANPVTERFHNLVELVCERAEKKGKCYYVRLFSKFLEPVKYTHPANIKELLLDLSYNERVGNLFTHFSALMKNLTALHSHLEEAPVDDTRNLISEYYKLLWELKQPILGQQLDPSIKEQLEKMWGAHSSILVCSASTLRKDIHWNDLVGNAEKRQCLVKVSKPYTAFFSDDSLESMRTKEEVSPNKEVQIDELDYSMQSYTVGDAGEAQGDDNVYGDGDDMDMDDGGFGDD